MLLIAAVTQVAMAPPADAKPKGKDPRTIPLMVSAAKGKPVKELPQPDADFTPLMADGGKAPKPNKSSFDPKTSKESGRAENSIEFTNADGSKTVVLSKDPLSVPDGKGGWAPLDTRLVDKKDSKKAIPARAGIGVELAEFANDPALFQVNQNGTPVTIELKGAGKAGRKVSGSIATYVNALPNTDVAYEITADSVKESIVLKTGAAVGDGKWDFTLKAGALTPKVDGNVVKIFDKSGKAVAMLPPIEVWDSAGSEKDKKPSARTGGAYGLVREGENWLLSVAVDKKWLTDKARKFPITVDPTYTWGFGQQSEAVTYNQGGLPCSFSCGVRTGNARNIIGQNAFWRSALRYDLTPLAGKSVTSARMDLKLASTAAEQKPASQVKLFQATTPRSFTALGAELASASIGETGSLAAPALVAMIDDRAKATDKNAWFMLGGTETNTYSYKQLQASLIVDYADGPDVPPPPGPQVNMVGPVEGSTIATDVPTLEVGAGPSGTKYCFKISTGFDGRSGSVVDSGCLTTPTWTVPKDVLSDGARYTWSVATVPSGGSTSTPQNWVGHFTINKRIGNAGPAPTDQFGPVTTNLFNGNVQTSAAGPAFEALGGSAGVTFAYNSRSGGDAHGVRASYFNDANHDGAPDATPMLVRNEAQVNLDWGNWWSNAPENNPFREDPMPPALDKQWHVIRWEGYFMPAVTGDFSFAGSHADGAKIWIDNKLTYDNPNPAEAGSAFTTAGPKLATDVSLTAGVRVPIKVEMYHSTTSKPKMVLWAKSTTGTTSRTHNWNPRVVTSEWLFSSDPAPLSRGWTLGLMGSKYVQAEMLDGSVVLTDASGGKHGWTKQSAGGYSPPADEDGVLAVDVGGRISVTVDGTVSVFNVDGTLAAVSTVADSKKPASLQYLYSGTPARLTQIKDPVSGRAHTLYYNTDNTNNCYGGASFPTGTHAAPLQKLCRIQYWDGTETRLWYIAGVLGRIENPGSEIRDYSYLDLNAAKTVYDNPNYSVEERLRFTDRIGPLNEVRDSLAVDLRAIGAVEPNGAERTTIEYEEYVDDPTGRRPAHLRPYVIYGPAADGRSFNQRPNRALQYRIFENKAWIIPRGIDVTTRTVTWDDAGRLLTDTNAVGDTSRSEWNAKDKPIASIDAAGRRSTVVYDHADRPTDGFGPAPGDCFNGQLPKPECAETMPHGRRNYDEHIVGLEAAYYDNPFLAGVPKDWATGVGAADGSLTRVWGASPPVANSAGWSGRFTGEIKFDTVGEYKLGFTVVDGVRLWIDELLTVDSWSNKPATAVSGTFTNTVAGSWHKVRVDYYNGGGNTGALDMTWTPPSSGNMITIPGHNLAPRYGLPTSVVSDNTSGTGADRAPSNVLSIGYADQANGIDPVLGLATSKTADPGGMNLTGRKLFEQPGQGFLRQTSATMPAGDLANPDKRSNSTYYGDAETRANPCETQSQAVHQGGRVKTVRGAQTSDGVANTLETVYNAGGQVVAMRTNNEPWACTSYDGRGRTAKKSFPAMGSQPGRTITFDYAAGGDPRANKASDETGSTVSVVNLQGKVTSFTDASGVVTTAAYDMAGRMTSMTSTIKGVTSKLDYRYNNASQLTGVDLDGTTVATPTYTAGELRQVGYGNSTNLALVRNSAGAASSLAWGVPGSTVTSTVTRGRDQRITDEAITDTAGAGTTFNSAYTYDKVGRLVSAAVPFHQLTYSFAADNGCGPNPKAGLNSNRTSFSDSLNGAPAATTTYCYDNADRLLSTTGATNLALTYDNYGNTTKIGGDTLTYDSTLRHMSTAAAGRTVTYSRDVTDRIVGRTVQDNGAAAQVTRYGFVSNSGGPDFVLDSGASLRQRVVKLPGGAVLTKTYGQTATNWSYPNVHGSILFTANGSGARTGVLHLYDPYGQNIDPVTGVIGDIPIPATAEGGMDFGWLGQHTVPVEHVGSQQALEMGARTYLPILGRFLQVDPVVGGSANSYDYGNADPINSLDLTGRSAASMAAGVGAGAALLALAIVVAPEVAIVGAGVAAGVVVMNALDDDDESSSSSKSDPPPAKAPAPEAAAGAGAAAAGAAAAWPTPTNDNCKSCAEAIQAQIGGKIVELYDKAGAPMLGPSKNDPDGKWHEHYAVEKEGVMYDAFTGPKGLPVDEYLSQWKYGEYIGFR